MSNALCDFTTIGIGGEARRLIIADTARAIVDHPDALLLGRGSNVVVSDKGYDGDVVVNRFESVDIIGDVAVAGSGTRLCYLCERLLSEGLGGMEWAFGIPGTVGGAVKMNAGAFGGAISDVLLYADILRDGKLVRLSREELGLSYRSSGIKQPDRVVYAAFRLHRDDRAHVRSLMSSYAAKRRAAQPSARSAGSVFKNPSGKSVAKLLDSAGFKGYGKGGAMVSREHANIIVNVGGATAKDVISVVADMKSALTDMGVSAEEEIEFIGEI